MGGRKVSYEIERGGGKEMSPTEKLPLRVEDSEEDIARKAKRGVVSSVDSSHWVSNHEVTQ